MILSDCSLSFCLPGTQMRRCIKSPLNLRLLCHVFFFSLVPFYEITQGSGATHKTICANMHKEACAHIQMCSFTHVHTHTHQLNQSLKVSEASISFCKSATIRRWVLFPLSLGVGFWPVGRRLFIVSVSAPVDSQPLIYGSRLIESSTGL